MRPPYIRPAEAPSRINSPELLDLAERVGVGVWRFDAVRGRVVQVESAEDVDFFLTARASPPADRGPLPPSHPCNTEPTDGSQT